MRLLAIILLGLIGFTAQATVYKWVDENGKVHYSDEPRDGAKVLQLKENTQNHVKLPPPVVISNPQDESQAKAEPVNYQVSIQSPDNDATIRDNQGKITVISQVTPKLIKSHYLVLFMDNRRISEPQTNGLFQLENIDRGAHHFVVKAIDQNGKVLASSQPRQVYLHRVRVGQGVKRAVNNAN